ncbi:uncharacterized protein V1516DRAFT_275812 [Lipomyces oligophaga]|uniref:uncharacterized protein n=1 Tax=Lipomyces oligophaga TaxID=45792 RepID=UPI0034CF4FD6
MAQLSVRPRSVFKSATSWARRPFHKSERKLNGISSEPEYLDHRQIGSRQQLFMLNENTPGSVFFLPHGTRIFNTLLSFIRAQVKQYGFDEVVSPIIYKSDLWKTSGHWEKYEQDMFSVQGRAAHSVQEYGLKPMNCPGHCLIYKHIDKSYRELPVRYSDFSPLHRNESATTITGLTRVRRFHQDDGHIFCRSDQISQEIKATLELIDNVYKVFEIPSYRLLLSTRPDTFIGAIEDWDRAEDALRSTLEATQQPWEINEGDGAFYGPKIDVMLKDRRGKEHQAATIQLDFQLPQRFDLKYKDENDTVDNRPVMIHRAVFGSLERFMALLIEHYQGKWPLWLSPRQVLVLPLTSRNLDYARKVQESLSGISQSQTKHIADFTYKTLYVDVDERSEPLNSRLREGILKGYSYIAVVGDREMDAKTVALREANKKPTVMDLYEAKLLLQRQISAFK